VREQKAEFWKNTSIIIRAKRSVVENNNLEKIENGELSPPERTVRYGREWRIMEKFSWKIQN
jgi:hypothetical protein